MSLSNLMDLHFTAAEMNDIRTAMSTVQGILSAKSRNLSPDERRKFGRVKEQNKLFINKVRDFHAHQPALSSPDVDWQEFEADFLDRNFLEQVLSGLNTLAELAGDAKILHDFDVYKAALTDYDYTKYKKGTDSLGYDTKYHELSQFFTGGSRGSGAEAGTGTDPGS
ncbi:MAG: hypothetical protein ACT6QS_17775 [Flavobacteriales bacterium]